MRLSRQRARPESSSSFPAGGVCGYANPGASVIKNAAFGPTISNCHFSGNAYYGLDLEEVSGTVVVSDCEHTGNGRSPSAGLIYGGYIVRDVAHRSANNLKSSLTDSNSFVIQSVDAKANLQDWTIDGLSLTGTQFHGATLYVAFNYLGAPQRVSLRTVLYDNWSMYVNGAPCSRSAPRQQLLAFENIRASGLYKGTQSPWDFQAHPGQMTYVLGRDSDLGTATLKPLTGNQGAIFLDLAGVQGSGLAPAAAPFHC
jgi:hypothetical protein